MLSRIGHHIDEHRSINTHKTLNNNMFHCERGLTGSYRPILLKTVDSRLTCGKIASLVGG